MITILRIILSVRQVLNKFSSALQEHNDHQERSLPLASPNVETVVGFSAARVAVQAVGLAKHMLLMVSRSQNSEIPTHNLMLVSSLPDKYLLSALFTHISNDVCCQCYLM